MVHQEQNCLFGLSQLTATWLPIIGRLSRVTDYRPGPLLPSTKVDSAHTCLSDLRPVDPLPGYLILMTGTVDYWTVLV